MKRGKTFVFNLIMGFSLLIAAVFWLLAVIPATRPTFAPEGMRGSIGEWIAVIICFGWAIAFIARGIVTRKTTSNSATSRLWIIFGVILATVAVVLLAVIFSWAGGTRAIVMPIIAVGIALALLVAMIVVAGRKWDAGMNDTPNADHTYKKTTWETRNEQLAAQKAEQENEKENE